MPEKVSCVHLTVRWFHLRNMSLSYDVWIIQPTTEYFN